LKRVIRICRFWLMLVIIHFRKYHIWNMRRKRTDQSISWMTWRNFISSFPPCSNNGWQTGGKQADKALKRWNDQANWNTGFEDQAGNFSGNKIGNLNNIEQTAGLEVDQTAKPNQTSLALSLRFLSPWHYQEMFTKGRFYTKSFWHQNIKTWYKNI